MSACNTWQPHGVSYTEETAGYRACKAWLDRQNFDVTIRRPTPDSDLIAFNWDTHTLLAKAPCWRLLASRLGLAVHQ